MTKLLIDHITTAHSMIRIACPTDWVSFSQSAGGRLSWVHEA